MTRYPRITTKQKVAAGYATPVNPGGECPVEGYGAADLITQSLKKSENGNIDELVNVYEIIPPLSDQIGFGYNVEYMNGKVA